MPRITFNRNAMWMYSILQYRSLVPATFHIVAITLMSMSLVQVPWFVITGGVCTPFLSLGQFFWFGYTNKESHSSEYNCINVAIVNLMRTIILLSFMAIIFSLAGFFLDILGPKHRIYRFARKYALASTCTVFFILTILSLCFYITVLLQESLENMHPQVETTVSYGYGFYLTVATGGIVLLGSLFTLILMQTTDSIRDDERCLINRYNDGVESCEHLAPPPPYSIPPPPYTP